MPFFEFEIRDRDGLWGSLGIERETAAEAMAACVETIDREELEPNGSVLPGYTIALLRAYCDTNVIP